jgi:hypothetical protein
MKKLILTLGIAAFGFTAVNAQTQPHDEQQQQPGTEQQQQPGDQEADQMEGREMVSPEDLPEGIREEITTGDLSDAQILGVYEVEADQLDTEEFEEADQLEEAETLYEVEAIKDGERKSVYFDEEGNKLERKEKKEGDHEGQEFDQNNNNGDEQYK